MTATQIIKCLLGRGITVSKAVIIKDDFPSVMGCKPYIKNTSKDCVAIRGVTSISHEASLFGGVVSGTSILPARMASPLSSNTPQPGVQRPRCFCSGRASPAPSFFANVARQSGFVTANNLRKCHDARSV